MFPWQLAKIKSKFDLFHFISVNVQLFLVTKMVAFMILVLLDCNNPAAHTSN